MRRRALVCSAFLLFGIERGAMAGPPPTSAPPTPAAASADARQHFKRGTTLYEETDYRGALAEFQRAYEILPNPVVLINIAQSYYQLTEYVNALRTFEKYLGEKDPTGAQRRTLATKAIEELKLRVADIEIQTNVAGAEIAVDDEVIGPSPQTVRVAVGRRRISATLSGYKPASKTVDVASGAAPPIALDLVEDKPESTKMEAPHAAASTSKLPGPLALGAFGIGGVGLVVGTVFGVLALGNRSTLDDKCTIKASCPPDMRSEKDALERNGLISTVGFIVGILGIGAGATLWLTGKDSAIGSSPATGRVGLLLGPMTGVHGTF